jgi:hypothetical protein
MTLYSWAERETCFDLDLKNQRLGRIQRHFAGFPYESIDAQIPPPTMNHTKASMKNIFAESRFLERLTSAIMRNMRGGPKVIPKKKANIVANSSIRDSRLD